MQPSQLALIASALLATAASSSSANSFRIPNSCKEAGDVALTFDDGVSKNTAALLKTLREKDVDATFHVNVQHLQDPYVAAMLRQIVADGHTLGIRTPISWNLDGMSDAELQDGLMHLRQQLADLTGKTPKYLRFPYGQLTAERQAVVASLGMVATEHNLDAKDYVSSLTPDDILKNFQTVVDRIVAPALGSFISTQHSASLNSTLAVAGIVDYFRDRGYDLVDLSDCLGDQERYIPPGTNTGGHGGGDNSGDSGNEEVGSGSDDGSGAGDDATGDASTVYLSSIVGLTIILGAALNFL